MHGTQGTPPPSTFQKNRVPESSSSDDQAVVTPWLEQHCSLLLISWSNSVHLPLRIMADQQVPPITKNFKFYSNYLRINHQYNTSTMKRLLLYTLWWWLGRMEETWSLQRNYQKIAKDYNNVQSSCIPTLLLTDNGRFR